MSGRGVGESDGLGDADAVGGDVPPPGAGAADGFARRTPECEADGSGAPWVRPATVDSSGDPLGVALALGWGSSDGWVP